MTAFAAYLFLKVLQDFLFICMCIFFGCICIYKSYILLLDYTLKYHMVTFFVIIAFVLKCALSDTSIAALAFFPCTFAWDNFFPSVYFQPV